MKKGNLIFSAICIVLSVLVIIIASGYPTAEDYGTGVPGPGLWPSVISSVILFCSVLLLINTLRLAPEDDKVIKLLSKDHIRVYISMGILLVYTLLLPTVGFIIDTVIMLFIFIQWFSKKKIYISLLIAIAITLISYFAFNNLLNVPVDFGFFAL